MRFSIALVLMLVLLGLATQTHGNRVLDKLRRRAEAELERMGTYSTLQETDTDPDSPADVDGDASNSDDDSGDAENPTPLPDSDSTDSPADTDSSTDTDSSSGDDSETLQAQDDQSDDTELAELVKGTTIALETGSGSEVSAEQAAELKAEVYQMLMYEAGEHRVHGDAAWKKAGDSLKLGIEVGYIGAIGGQKLSYGEAIAASGDFYALEDPAIYKCGKDLGGSKCQGDFEKAFKTFWGPWAKKADFDDVSLEIKRILPILRNGEGPIQAKTRQMEAIDEYFTKYLLKGEKDYMQNRFDVNYARITNGDPPLAANEPTPQMNPVLGYLNIGPFPAGRFIDLALDNIDHFNTWAVHAYQIAHLSAMREAVAAAKEKDATKKKARLARAMQKNAWADHYLTDLFASGHIRSPRLQMVSWCTGLPRGVGDLNTGTNGGLIAKCMHDEDNILGLTMIGVDGKTTWRAYGDKTSADFRNDQNRARTINAVVVSINEIWHAFNTKTEKNPVNFGALQLVPSVELTTRSCGTNFAPMLLQHPQTKEWQYRVSSPFAPYPMYKVISNCGDIRTACRDQVQADLKTLVKKYLNKPAPQPVPNSWPKPGKDCPKGWHQPPSNPKPPEQPPKPPGQSKPEPKPQPKQPDPSAVTKWPNAWPCSRYGVQDGKCVPQERCTGEGGDWSGGFCPGKDNIVCCHLGPSLTKANAAYPKRQLPVICNMPGKGTCIPKGDCTTTKGTHQANCSNGNNCCLHKPWCNACNDPNNPSCRSCWA